MTSDLERLMKERARLQTDLERFDDCVKRNCFRTAQAIINTQESRIKLMRTYLIEMEALL
jgi:hypothetical protein